METIMNLENNCGKVMQKCERQRTVALISIISDGKSKFIGIVDEISRNGLRLTQIPARFDESIGKCTAIVLGPNGDVEILIHPCWVKLTTGGMYKTIGCKIYTPPVWWQEFIRELEENPGPFSYLLTKNDSF